MDQTGWGAASAWVSPHHPHSQNEAMEMMDQIVSWVREDPSGLGRPQLPGAPASESMAVPMMLLNLVEQLGEADEELAGISAELGDWCTQRILQHVQVGAGGRCRLPDQSWGAGAQSDPHSPPPGPYPPPSLVISNSLDPMNYSPPGSLVHGDSPRPEYWSGLLCPPPGDLPHPGIEPRSAVLCRQILYHLSHQGSPLMSWGSILQMGRYREVWPRTLGKGGGGPRGGRLG